MVIVSAGRRPDPSGATTARFPVQNVVGVREQIRAELLRQKPEDVICGAACGADLLLLDAAGELGIRRHLVISGTREEFRKSSVADRPGGWEILFDRIVEAAGREGGVDFLRVAPGLEGYLATNLELLKAAEETAAQRGGGVVALAIWDLKSRGDGDVTQHFIASARSRGHQVIEISTLL